MFVGAALAPGPSAGAAGARAADYADVVTAWMADGTADGEVGNPAETDTVTNLWRDADGTTDDLLIDVLLADGLVSALPETDEATR